MGEKGSGRSPSLNAIFLVGALCASARTLIFSGRELAQKPTQ